MSRSRVAPRRARRLVALLAASSALAALTIGTPVGAAAGPAGAATVPQMRSASAAGPIKVAGTTTGSVVASLALPKGDWTVFATGDIRNRSLASHPATCKLTVGKGTDKVSLHPADKTSASSRMSLLLTASSRLTAGTTAQVRCAAPGSTSGSLVAENLRLWGVKTSTLIVSTGAGTTTFGNPLAPSQVLSATIGGYAGLNGSEAPVAIVTVPQAGDWAITAKGTAFASSSTPSSVTCSLSAGDVDRTALHVAAKGQAADRRPFALQIVHHFASTGPTTLACAGASTSIRVKDLHLTAYRVGDLTNQDLEQNGNFSVPSGTPAVDAGYADGPTTLVANTASPIANMSLPVGAYHVVAKGYLDNTYQFADSLVTCTLGSSLSHATTKLALGVFTEGTQSFVLEWSSVLGSRTDVTLRCRTALAGVQVRWVKMTAYRGVSLLTTGG